MYSFSHSWDKGGKIANQKMVSRNVTWFYTPVATIHTWSVMSPFLNALGFGSDCIDDAHTCVTRWCDKVTVVGQSMGYSSNHFQTFKMLYTPEEN